MTKELSDDYSYLANQHAPFVDQAFIQDNSTSTRFFDQLPQPQRSIIVYNFDDYLDQNENAQIQQLFSNGFSQISGQHSNFLNEAFLHGNSRFSF